MNATDLPLIASVRTWHGFVPELSVDHLYEAVRTGELRAIRRGRRVLIPRSALLAWLGEPVSEEPS